MGQLMKLVSTIFKSKTLIMGWLTFIVGLLTYLSGDAWVKQYPDVVGVLLSALGVLQIILRTLTKLPLSEK